MIVHVFYGTNGQYSSNPYQSQFWKSQYLTVSSLVIGPSRIFSVSTWLPVFSAMAYSLIITAFSSLVRAFRRLIVVADINAIIAGHPENKKIANASEQRCIAQFKQNNDVAMMC